MNATFRGFNRLTLTFDLLKDTNGEFSSHKTSCYFTLKLIKNVNDLILESTQQYIKFKFMKWAINPSMVIIQ